MVVKNFFNDIEYPDDFKSREKIFKQYHEKINHISGGEMKKKDFNMTILLDLFAIIGVIAVFMYGEVSIILKAVYIIPSIIFAIYDLFLACKVKYKECNEKNLYKKQVSMLTLVNIYIFLGTYIFQVISLGDKFTNQICIFGVGLRLVSQKILHLREHKVGLLCLHFCQARLSHGWQNFVHQHNRYKF